MPSWQRRTLWKPWQRAQYFSQVHLSSSCSQRAHLNFSAMCALYRVPLPVKSGKRASAAGGVKVGIFLDGNSGANEPKPYLVSAATARGERVVFQHRDLVRVAVPLMHDLINA